MSQSGMYFMHDLQQLEDGGVEASLMSGYGKQFAILLSFKHLMTIFGKPDNKG